MTESRRAIIIGGGIGGLATAIALQHAGWDAHVYERTSTHRGVGAGLVLWANAIRALDALGVAGQIRALKPPAPSAGLYTASGKILLQASVEALERQVGEMSIVVLAPNYWRFYAAPSTIMCFTWDGDVHTSSKTILA